MEKNITCPKCGDKLHENCTYQYQGVNYCITCLWSIVGQVSSPFHVATAK